LKIEVGKVYKYNDAVAGEMIVIVREIDIPSSGIFTCEVFNSKLKYRHDCGGFFKEPIGWYCNYDYFIREIKDKSELLMEMLE